MSNRTTRNESSVRKLLAFLREVAQDPAKHVEDAKLKLALASQGALARLDVPDAGITPMALNTAKRTARKVLDEHDGVDGYGQLDRLRLSCAEALDAVRTSPPEAGARETKTTLRARAEQAEREVQILSEDLQLATGLLRECLRQAKSYAKRADAATQALCEREQRDLFQMLGLVRTKPK